MRPALYAARAHAHLWASDRICCWMLSTLCEGVSVVEVCAQRPLVGTEQCSSRQAVLLKAHQTNSKGFCKFIKSTYTYIHTHKLYPTPCITVQKYITVLVSNNSCLMKGVQTVNLVIACSLVNIYIKTILSLQPFAKPLLLHLIPFLYFPLSHHDHQACSQKHNEVCEEFKTFQLGSNGV